MTGEVGTNKESPQEEKPKLQGFRSFKEVEEEDLFYQFLAGDRQVREHRATYFEKLTLFNAATIALTVTAVLGNFHDKVTHRYTLRTALCSLVVAMFFLMLRNFIWMNHESKVNDVRFSLVCRNSAEAVKEIKEIGKLSDMHRYLGMLGVGLTALGVLLLLIVVLPII